MPEVSYAVAAELSVWIQGCHFILVYVCVPAATHAAGYFRVP